MTGRVGQIWAGDVWAAAGSFVPKNAATDPAKSAAATLSEPFDLSAPDRINDAAFNEVLWLMLKGEAPQPEVRTTSSMHAYQISK